MFDSFDLWALPGSFTTMKASRSAIISVSEVNPEAASTITNSMSIDPDGNMATSAVQASASKATNTGGIVEASAGTDNFSAPNIQEPFFMRFNFFSRYF
ncbi:MAG: hypothetical protein F6K56_26290 [Moorea sp. SIO3G5]|nr:hypothetical protein [Moorena sp. SIO3G5]